MQSLFLTVVGLLSAGQLGAGEIVFRTNPTDTGLTLALRGRAEVVALAAEQTALRRQLLRWKEADFRRLFGEPLSGVETAGVPSVTEQPGLMLSGLTYDGARRHTDTFRVTDLGRLEVWFGNDGVMPMYIGLQLRAADGFIPVKDADTLGRRVAWERTVLRQLRYRVADRWRATVGWEVDLDTTRAVAPLTESHDLAAKVPAFRRIALWDGLVENHPIARLWCFESLPNGRGRMKAYIQHVREGAADGEWYWTDGDRELVNLSTRRWGTSDADWSYDLAVKPKPDVTAWDESGVHGHVRQRRFNRPDGSMVRYEGFEVQDGVYRAAVWTWYARGGHGIRTERDTNADGVPDAVSAAAFHESATTRPLAVEDSWAVRPELVPPEYRVPGQPGRRLPVRRLP